ncbi:hypothetical protein V8B97DRAFT_1880936 [Scleroderma yunnanense]
MSFPLPDELIASIFEDLDVPSLLRCMRVCKRFQPIILQSSALLYKISLFSAQMSDVKHCDWDLPRRLEAIQRYTDSWNDLQFPTHKQIPMEDAQPWDLVNGVLTQARPDGGISCVQMPCSIKGIPEHRWVTPTDFLIRDFTIDISQDLLVAVEFSHGCDIHLRSCTTGMVHPETTCPRIRPSFLSIRTRSCFLIRVCGPYIGVLFSDRWLTPSAAAFAVWDWRTGTQKMLIRGREFRSFTFISDELILVVFISGGQVSLRILPVIHELVSSASDVEYLCELRYPKLRATVDGVLIISEPSPTSTVPTNFQAPFTYSSTDVLFTITLKYSLDTVSMSAVVLLVPRSTILSHVSSISTSPEKHLEWESWGAKGSRMLLLAPSDIWVCHTYGMKYIHKDGGVSASIYDFNPYVTNKDVNTASCPRISWTAMEKETIIRGRTNPFEMDVVTSLPGRKAPLPLTPNGNGWEAAMITEDHIVMVQVS